MKRSRSGKKSRAYDQAEAARWAAELESGVRGVLATAPDADPENVRHTLILLQMPPLERLRRSLIRARRTAIQC